MFNCLIIFYWPDTVMSRYMLSLLRRGQLEVLSRRTISGDRSKPDSEFYVARCAARRLGINVVYGDQDIQFFFFYNR
ncbi:hypothetical protein QL285_035109 [Trifolium repens]|nr:hypothetical protein QL285_035109 [Trifolium repens]